MDPGAEEAVKAMMAFCRTQHKDNVVRAALQMAVVMLHYAQDNPDGSATIYVRNQINPDHKDPYIRLRLPYGVRATFERLAAQAPDGEITKPNAPDFIRALVKGGQNERRPDAEETSARGGRPAFIRGVIQGGKDEEPAPRPKGP
jgi:hypothetical protein